MQASADQLLDLEVAFVFWALKGLAEASQKAHR